MDLTTVVTSLASSGVLSLAVVLGLGKYVGERWMVRYKSSLDKEFEAYRDVLEQRRKRIEAELGHRTYIGKAQFDTEYGALKECFATLGRLRLSFNGLRPFSDWVPDDGQEKFKELVRRLSHFKDRYNPFVDAYQSLYPFLPGDIYVQFEQCAKAALLEIRHIEEDITKALTPSGYQQAIRQSEQFERAYFAAAKLAQERFRELAVVPD